MNDSNYLKWKEKLCRNLSLNTGFPRRTHVSVLKCRRTCTVQRVFIVLESWRWTGPWRSPCRTSTEPTALGQRLCELSVSFCLWVSWDWECPASEHRPHSWTVVTVRTGSLILKLNPAPCYDHHMPAIYAYSWIWWYVGAAAASLQAKHFLFPNPVIQKHRSQPDLLAPLLAIA